jgi:hypothetical protein
MTNLKLPTMTIENLKRVRPRDGKIGYATDIMWNADRTKVGIYHHQSLIAVIDESGHLGHQRIISFSNGGWDSKTTIHRLHLILRENTRGYYGARIQQFTGYVTCTQSHYTGGFMHELSSRFYSIIVNDDNPSNLITDESLYNGVC